MPKWVDFAIASALLLHHMKPLPPRVCSSVPVSLTQKCELISEVVGVDGFGAFDGDEEFAVVWGYFDVGHV